MRPESVIQRAIRVHLGELGFTAVHVPNGAVLGGDEARRARQMNALKADGLYPGFPDLIVYAPGGQVAHIEVKTPKGKLQDTQKRCEAWLTGLGHKYAVCRSKDEAVDALRQWGWL